MQEQRLPNRCQAVKAALQEWALIVRRRVASPGVGHGLLGPGDHHFGVPNPASVALNPIGAEGGEPQGRPGTGEEP